MIKPETHNRSQSINFKVHLMFVSPNNQDGYCIEDVSHADSKEAAVVEILMRHMNEMYPLKGITVYQCVFSG